jgi:hypothetical protein
MLLPCMTNPIDTLSITVFSGSLISRPAVLRFSRFSGVA